MLIQGSSVPATLNYVKPDWGIPLRSRSVQCVVTSPPYWFNRSYSETGVEFGLEPLPLYVYKWGCFVKELHRVLRDDGLFFFNVGDTSSGSGGAGGDHYNDKGSKRNVKKYAQPKGYSGLAVKQDCNVPARLAIETQEVSDDDGNNLWLQRKEIIWDKELVERCDANHIRRPKTQTERIYMFCKAGINSVKDYKFYPDRLEFPGDVWRFPVNRTKKNSDAPFPDKLAELCILPSTDPGDIVFDPFAGSGTTMKVAERFGRVGVGVERYL